MQPLLIFALVAVASASHAIHSFDECYREGDIVLDTYNRCKYRVCEKVEPEHGYGHFELKDKECTKGSGVPYFLLQQYMHGVYAGHRFIGSHLASTVCGDKYVKDCTARHGYGYGQGYGHGYGHQGYYAAPYGHVQYNAYPTEKEEEKKSE